MVKKRKASEKDKLEKEMLSYYKSLNQQRKTPTKKERNWYYLKVIINIFISIILTTLIFLIIQGSYTLTPTLSFLIFAIIFMGIFANAEFILNKNEDRHKFWVGIIIQLLIIFIMFGQLEISSIQTSILKDQTNIMESSNPPYYPYIQIIPDYKDLNIPAWELVDTQNFNEGRSEESKWAKIGMTFYNFGEMDSQHIFCFQEWFINGTIGVYITPDSNIDNLPAGTSLRALLHVRSVDCQPQSKEFCKKELIPTGRQQTNLSCECYGCKYPQRYFKVPIDFCIYNENKTGECPDNYSA